jgi:hypothetical protein
MSILTLTFYVKSHNKKQAESRGLIGCLERSSVSHTFGLDEMLSLRISGLVACQINKYLGSTIVEPENVKYAIFSYSHVLGLSV